MSKIKQLKYFIDVVENCGTLKGEFSGLSLIEQLQRYSHSLMLEITERKLNKSKEETLLYLQFVSDSLSRLSYDKINKIDVISGYLDEYNSSIDDIEIFSISNPELESLLTEFYFDQGNPMLKDKAFFMQRQLVDYFKSKYILEVLSFCNSSPFTHEKNDKYNDEIFKSKSAEDAFYLIIDESGLVDSNNNPKRKFPAYLSAVWENPICKKDIYNYDLTKLTMTKFLNSKYNLSMDPTSWSSGVKHEFKVKEIIKNINLGNPNKPK